MNDIKQEHTLDDMDVVIVDFLQQHVVRAAKALAIGMMALFAVLIINGSFLKALTVSLAFLLLSLFNSFRVIISPLTIIVFVVALGLWLGIDLASSVQKIKAFLA